MTRHGVERLGVLSAAGVGESRAYTPGYTRLYICPAQIRSHPYLELAREEPVTERRSRPGFLLPCRRMIRDDTQPASVLRHAGPYSVGYRQAHHGAIAALHGVTGDEIGRRLHGCCVTTVGHWGQPPRPIAYPTPTAASNAAPTPNAPNII